MRKASSYMTSFRVCHAGGLPQRRCELCRDACARRPERGALLGAGSHGRRRALEDSCQFEM